MWGPAHALSEDMLSNEQLGLTPRILERLFNRINEVRFTQCANCAIYQLQ